jgi:hypothetical protein
MHGHGSGSRQVVKVAGGERGVNESHRRAPGEMGAPRTRPYDAWDRRSIAPTVLVVSALASLLLYSLLSTGEVEMNNRRTAVSRV